MDELDRETEEHKTGLSADAEHAEINEENAEKTSLIASMIEDNQLHIDNTGARENSFWKKVKKKLSSTAGKMILTGSLTLLIGLAGGYYWGANQAPDVPQNRPEGMSWNGNGQRPDGEAGNRSGRGQSEADGGLFDDAEGGENGGENY